MITYATPDTLGNILFTSQFDTDDFSPPNAVVIPENLLGIPIEDLWFNGLTVIQRMKRPNDCHIWDGSLWVLSVDILSRKLRAERNYRIAITDWTQLSDIPEATRLSWASYRQALRDVSQQPGFPQSIIWPDTPTAATTPAEVEAVDA